MSYANSEARLTAKKEKKAHNEFKLLFKVISHVMVIGRKNPILLHGVYIRTVISKLLICIDT